jgi:hypothetical protein
VAFCIGNGSLGGKGRPLDLCSEACLPNGQLYKLMLEYARTLFPQAHIVHDFSSEQGTMLLSNSCAPALPYVHVNGLRYGCLFNKQTAKDRFAFICRRTAKVPCQIRWLFQLHVPGHAPHLCAAIQRFVADDQLPQFPWDV